MAADLYIMAVKNTEGNIALIQSARDLCVGDGEEDIVEWGDEQSGVMTLLYGEIEDQVHISRVSFAKAWWQFDPYWIPGSVIRVLGVFDGEYLPKIAGHAISTEVTTAMNAPDRSHYRNCHRGNRGPAPRRAVKEFFKRNEGLLVFASVD